VNQEIEKIRQELASLIPEIYELRERLDEAFGVYVDSNIYYSDDELNKMMDRSCNLIQTLDLFVEDLEETIDQRKLDYQI
jgi:hypothetical protein